ncbi:MAG: hypothetical protein AB2A00_42575 [Myxococcota bacterium]
MTQTPPPLPPSSQAVAALKEAAGALDVEEILALCFSFSADPVRLTVYLDVLRRKGGQKAQAAACLVCFDLARRGDERFQAEFLSLVPVLVRFLAPNGAEGPHPVDELLGQTPYLHALWSDLEPRLRARDTRLDDARVEEVIEITDVTEVHELDLLDAGDLEDLSDLDVLVVDDENLWSQWRVALDRFLGFGNAPAGIEGPLIPAGFRADTKTELQRVEQLHTDALSLAEHVGQARSMLPLVELFLASHMRARNFFGTRNKAREALLKAGLEHFTALPTPDLMDCAGWLSEPYAAPFAWEKVAELLLDYVAFVGSLPRLPDVGLAEAYLAASRPQPPIPRLAEGHERRRR